MSDPPNTQLLFVQHLSPASRTKNPSVAYADRTLGEVRWHRETRPLRHRQPSATRATRVPLAPPCRWTLIPESITFLTAKKSPTGNAGILFSGSWSGTLSLYEFEGCQTVTGGDDDDDDDDEDEDDERTTTTTTTTT